jgi:IS30 family transposase
MDKIYTQLSLLQRYQIEALLKAGMRQKKIAQENGVHPSKISRELGRNTAKRGKTAGEYVADNAHAELSKGTTERRRWSNSYPDKRTGC